MSILQSVKIMLGIPEDHTAFDAQLIMHINSVFTILDQLGARSFTITGSDETWDDYFVDEDYKKQEIIKSYIPMKVRMMFDTPTGSVATSFEKMISEYEWRIKVGEES